ncbi:MAG TPA: lactonase family protein [Opitutaceae bacterium]|jgi:6-phosphogluconolactonase|nr:lactonase family protein [Opitutaceae bacterium]
MLVYFGTYTREASQGIYRSDFDPEAGTLTAPVLAARAANPTFLTTDPGGRHLYACGELLLEPKPPQAIGGAVAFAIDRAGGALRLLNQEATGGGNTVHVAVDATGRTLAIANYHDGYVAALPIRGDGRLGPRSAFFSHDGRAPLGPNHKRQDKAHAHCVIIAPDNRFVLSCDLAQDRVYSYRLDPEQAALAPADPPMAAAVPGSGPRHGRFSSDGRFLYVANEMGGTVSQYAYDAARGHPTLGESYSTLPEDFSGTNTVGEIRLHPRGRTVYVSNRGHESIAVFARDTASGRLERIQLISCGGKHPRNFELDPSGRWLLCANKDTNNVVLFSIDPASGRLTPAGREIAVPEVTCVLFA